jgi:transposase
MMSVQEELGKLRPELRYLRIRVQQLEKAHLVQKNKADELEDLLRERDKLIAELEKQRDYLTEDIEEMKRQRDVYRGMVYKPGKKDKSHPDSSEKKKKIMGAPKGHKGFGKKKPENIDQQIHAQLTHCPSCHTELAGTAATISHTITDLPHWVLQKPIVTEYTIERQWCKTCKKEVHATPKGVIPGSRFGSNLVTMVLVWKYRFRDPLNKIVERLAVFYGLSLSEAAVVGIMQRAKEWLGDDYEKLIIEIRGAEVKHADETGWRIKGNNGWAWVFLSKQSVYYTIEETRGKGIPEEKLQGATGVLIRDDYGGYTKLPIRQQSCWAHLLRKSHEAVEQERVSEEMQELHKKLKTMYLLLTEDLSQPFDQQERKTWHREYLTDIHKIIHTSYQAKDAQKIQTRIKNQRTNLITALLYQNVSLTNNDAERAIRPLVITRKISGGSRSTLGAKTHAVNMSIIETINKRKQPLLSTLNQMLLSASVKN